MLWKDWRQIATIDGQMMEGSQTSPYVHGPGLAEAWGGQTIVADLTSEKSPIPLYHRLFLLLRERLLSGGFRPGDTVPTESELVSQYGVSRITARRALDELASEGLISRSRGKRSVATEKVATLSGGGPLHAEMDTLMSNLNLIGSHTDVQVLRFDYVPAPVTIADKLMLLPETVVQSSLRLRSAKGRNLALSTSHVIESIGRTYSAEDMQRYTLVQLLLRAGVELGEVRQSISACLADDTMSELLQVETGSPMVVIQRLFIGMDGCPVDHVKIVYPADRFEYRITLKPR